MHELNLEDREPIAGPSPAVGSREPAASDGSALVALGISFDGRQYRYETYRYDRRDDAVAYAELDRARRASPARARS